jgi:hypothetical protein
MPQRSGSESPRHAVSCARNSTSTP